MSASILRNPTIWLVGLALVGVAWLMVLMSEPVDPYLARGEEAPFFDLPTLQGDGQVDASQLAGGVTLINFWATWCKPCEEEMPAMQALFERLSGQGFSLLAISVDESREDVQEFQERLGLTFPILLDPEQRTSNLYQTTGFPESFLVGPDGRIVERYVGPREWDHPDYVDRVDRLLRALPERSSGP